MFWAKVQTWVNEVHSRTARQSLTLSNVSDENRDAIASDNGPVRGFGVMSEMCARTKGTTRFFNERPLLSQPSWQSGQFGFLGGTATWLYAGISGEIPACGDVLTMNATRAASVHRRFLVCYAEVLTNCNEETSRCSRRLLRFAPTIGWARWPANYKRTVLLRLRATQGCCLRQ